jgi:type II secretory pathway component PulM
LNIPDYVKENLYLPYFRRLTTRARSQQILLGVGVGLLALALVAAWWLWNRPSSSTEAPAEA